jgi:NAD(P)-dependent dehydrogenase (short-subunit alcohol dehydrogenase family)
MNARCLRVACAVFQEVFAVDVFDTAATAHALLPFLKNSKDGSRIVNMGSELGSIGTTILPDGIYRQSQLLVSTPHESITKRPKC